MSELPRWPSDIDQAVRESVPEVQQRVTKEMRLAVRAEAERRRSLVAIMFMSFGGMMASVGAGFQWGLPAGLFVLGLAVFINGILIGM